MKKLSILFVLFLITITSFAQEKTYLVFEFMRVDNEQENAYWETESFWEKIHQERVKNGDILGWDLWSLKPGGEDQGYQYMTVNIYNDIEKMFTGGDVGKALKAAYPDVPEEKLQKMFNKTGKSRDLAVRLYLESISITEGDYDMPVGSIASIDFMKATGGGGAYINAEIETFLPLHQRAVDEGSKGSWELLRIMYPSGTSTDASHLTINMYESFTQMIKSNRAMWNVEVTEELSQQINEGVKTRDLTWVSLATLLKKVR